VVRVPRLLYCYTRHWLLTLRKGSVPATNHDVCIRGAILDQAQPSHTMPELAEVDAARQLLNRHAAGKRITAVTLDETDEIVLCAPPKALRAALLGKTIAAAARKGKQMWLELAGTDVDVGFHFGMTGSWSVRGVGSIEYVNTKKADPSVWPPRFAKVTLTLDDGTKLAFCNVRRLGRVRLFHGGALANAPINALGFDPAYELPEAAEFLRLFRATGDADDSARAAATYALLNAYKTPQPPLRFSSFPYYFSLFVVIRKSMKSAEIPPKSPRNPPKSAETFLFSLLFFLISQNKVGKSSLIIPRIPC